MRTILRRCATICAAFLFACTAHAAEPDFVPSADLLAAAKKEGKLVLYTANFLDTEQAVSKRFSERFGIQLEIVRAPTGSLITRIKTEAAANRLIADVIDFSDRVQARGMIELFAPYAPPNAADYPEVARTGRPAVAALRQRLDHHVQLRAREGPAEVLGRSGEARIRQAPPRADRGRGRRRPLQPRHVRTQGAGRGLLDEAGGAQAGAVSEPGPDGRCHDPRRDRDRAAGHQPRHSARRAGRAAEMVLRAGRRAGHGVLRRDRQGRDAIPMRRNCFSTGRCRARARR